MQFDVKGKTPLTEGGEGIIYNCKPGYVVKIFKPKIDLQSKRKKIDALIQANLPKEVIKPEDIVTDKHGNFIGMMMREINGEDFKKLANKKFVKTNNINTKDVLTMLARLWQILQTLHSQDIFVGDLNDQNVLLNPATKEIFIIDTDSWAIGGEHCLVAMDLFKDPKLVADNFNADTDTFAFCVLAWESLTRIHPYGGTTNPDMNPIERMKKGISVIDNSNVIIPKIAKSWRNLAPDLISGFKNVFNNGDRQFGNYIEDMLNNLAYCKTDRDYYFKGFSMCPICNNAAVVVKRAVSVGVENGFKVAQMLAPENVVAVYSEYVYLNNYNEIVDIASGRKESYISGGRFLFNNSHVVICFRDHIEIPRKNPYDSDLSYAIMYDSYPIMDNNELYLVMGNGLFQKFSFVGNSSSIGVTNIAKCSNRVYFNVKDGKYCIINIYDEKIIINIDGFFYEMDFGEKVMSAYAHYDSYADRWLVLIEDSATICHSYILEKNTLIWNSDKVSYKCPVYNLCIYGSVIYFPIDNAIRGLNTKSLQYKDFKCSVVNSDSILIKKGNQFIIVNDDNIYRFYK